MKDENAFVSIGCRWLLTAVISYVCHYEKDENKNFSFIAGLLVGDDPARTHISMLDEVFDQNAAACSCF